MTQQTVQKRVEPAAQIRSLVQSPAYMKSFEQALGAKAGLFATSVVNLVNQNQSLAQCEPNSIIKSAMIAATMELPISKDLGFAWVVPYKGVAQFQMGYKGFVQLALRTGFYEKINACEVYEGELVEYNRFTAEYKLDQSKRTSDNIVGFYAMFRMKNGAMQELYMDKKEMDAHRDAYSKSASKDNSIWKNDYKAMGVKTVLKLLLSKWGMLSIEMNSQALQTALKVDQAVITDPENLQEGTGFYYVDNEAPQVKDIPDAAASDTVNDIEEMVMEMCAEVPRDAKTVMKVIAFVRAESGMTDNAIRAAFREYREERKLPSIDWAKWWEAADVSDILAFASHVKKAK